MVGSVFMSIATYVVFIWKSIKSNHEKDEEAVLSKRNYTVNDSSYDIQSSLNLLHN